MVVRSVLAAKSSLAHRVPCKWRYPSASVKVAGHAARERHPTSDDQMQLVGHRFRGQFLLSSALQTDRGVHRGVQQDFSHG